MQMSIQKPSLNVIIVTYEYIRWRCQVFLDQVSRLSEKYIPLNVPLDDIRVYFSNHLQKI